MIQSLILVEGNTVKKDTLLISLSNAKQLVIGSAPAFGFILHVAANTATDLSNALLKFLKVAGVTGVVTLSLRST